MNTTTLHRSSTGRDAVEPIFGALNKAMARLMGSLNALDLKLSNRPTSVADQAADLLRIADSYESTQPSYAADLRAAATVALADAAH